MILWGECVCPECGEINWVNFGNAEDFRDGNSPEAYECHSCKKRFWVDEDLNEYEDDSLDIDSAYIEEGKPDPICE